MISWLGATLSFPPLSSAMTDPNGLLAAGGDLSPERLLAAYGRGIFPWSMEGQPLLWWSPDPRMVLYPAELNVPRSLAKVLRHKSYVVRFDTSFEAVMRHCGATPRPGQDGTWITADMLAGYCQLHRLGYAHSAECWMDGELVGGVYGVAIGKMFYGESMYAHKPDASKIAFVHLVRWLQAQGFGLIDCQMRTDHLARFGGREIARPAFVEIMTRLNHIEVVPAHWHYEACGEPNPVSAPQDPA